MNAKRAFTLIELLVVIAIVGVLSGLMLTAIGAARDSARASQSSSNLRQLALANLTFEVENGHYVPAQNLMGSMRWHGRREGNSFNPSGGYLSPYLGDDGEVRRCPLLDQWNLNDGSFEDGSGGYGYNSTYIGGTPGDFTRPGRSARIRYPSQTIMFATTALAVGEGIQEYPFAEPHFWDFGRGISSFRPDASVHFRARGKALIAWMDGHVSAESPSQLGENSIYGADPAEHLLGWIGPEENNGYWNPRR